jgi:gas vesicle protein
MSHSHSVTDDPKQVVGIALLAATVGAIVATLFAPKSGTETRQAIRTRAQEAKDRMKNSKTDMEQRASEAKDYVKDSVKSVDADDVASTVKRARRTIEKSDDKPTDK